MQLSAPAVASGCSFALAGARVSCRRSRIGARSSRSFRSAVSAAAYCARTRVPILPVLFPSAYRLSTLGTPDKIQTQEGDTATKSLTTVPDREGNAFEGHTRFGRFSFRHGTQCSSCPALLSGRLNTQQLRLRHGNRIDHR